MGSLGTPTSQDVQAYQDLPRFPSSSKLSNINKGTRKTIAGNKTASSTIRLSLRA